MPVVTVADGTMGQGRRLGVSWAPGNCLALHARHPRGHTGASDGVRGARVHEVRWETTLYEPGGGVLPEMSS